MLKTANQHIEYSEKIGGARVVFEGHPNVLPGGFVVDDVANLPTYPNVLPAGTPILCDESLRTFKVHYAFKAKDASTTTKVNIVVGPEGSRIKKGMKVMIAPTDVTTAGTGVTVSAVVNKEGYDEVTLSAAINCSAGDVIVECDATGASAKVKVVPNALLDRDVIADSNAKMVNATGVWYNDRPVLENRIPPIAPAVKNALKNNECYFRFSTRR